MSICSQAAHTNANTEQLHPPLNPPHSSSPPPLHTNQVVRRRERDRERRREELLGVHPVAVQRPARQVGARRHCGQRDLGVVLQRGHVLVLALICHRHDPDHAVLEQQLGDHDAKRDDEAAHVAVLVGPAAEGQQAARERGEACMLGGGKVVAVCGGAGRQ